MGVYPVCMARRNISLPDDLDEAARAEGLNVSALAQEAIVGALEQRVRMARLGAWLDELDAEHGPPAEDAVAEAEAWVGSGTGVASPHLLTEQALEGAATVAREAGAAKTKSRAARTGRAVTRDAKSGAFTANRTVARGAKTISKSARSSRSRGTKR